MTGRTPSPCWGAFDGVALHEAHAYDGKWCPGLSGRGTSSDCNACGGPCRTPYCAACGDEHPPGDCSCRNAGYAFDGSRYVARCGCGWQTTPRTTYERAQAALRKHLTGRP